MTVEQAREWLRPLNGRRHLMLLPVQNGEVRELMFQDIGLTAEQVQPQADLFSARCPERGA